MSEDDSADDDWFESAFTEESEADAEDEPATAADEVTPDEDTPTEGTPDEDRSATASADTDDFDAEAFDDETRDGEAFDGEGSGPFGDTDSGPFDDSDSGAFGSTAGSEPADDGDESPFDGGGSPFGDTGVDDTESPFGDTGVDDDDPFGTDSGQFDEDDAGAGDDDALFDESFGDAMGSSGGSSTDFDADEVDSDIPRLDLGIEGLDNMIQGGVPERHLMVVIGGAGTGKTTFGLQFLRHGLNLDDPEKAVFITLEQTYEDIMATAEERGWEFHRHEREGNLAVVDLDPVEMANSLDNIRGELPELIEEFGADRFVLDSVSLLEMMYDEQARRRTEIFDFTQSLKQAGVTTVFTSEASEDNPYASRHGIIEYLTDAVFLLRYVRSETQETRLAVEIQKIRNANHSRETKPYEITLDGISVYEQANIF